VILKIKYSFFSSLVFDGIPRNKQQITATGGAVLGEAEQIGRLFNVKETLEKTEGGIKNGQSRDIDNIEHKTNIAKKHNTEN